MAFASRHVATSAKIRGRVSVSLAAASKILFLSAPRASSCIARTLDLVHSRYISNVSRASGCENRYLHRSGETHRGLVASPRDVDNTVEYRLDSFRPRTAGRVRGPARVPRPVDSHARVRYIRLFSVRRCVGERQTRGRIIFVRINKAPRLERGI